MNNIIKERNKEVTSILNNNKRFMNIVLRSVRNFSGLEQDDKKSILYELLLKHTEQWLNKNKPCKLTTYLYWRLVRDLKYILNKEQLLINTCSNIDNMEIKSDNTTDFMEKNLIKDLILELISSEYVPNETEKELLRMRFIDGYTPKDIEQRTEFTRKEFNYIHSQFITSVKRSINNKNFAPKKTPDVILRKAG